MNTFRTVVPQSKFPFKISHKSQILCVGSCFAEHIGGFFHDHKFNTVINPCGISYNPISICDTINRLVDNTPILADELVTNNNRYYHWGFHGEYSSDSPDTLIAQLNDTVSNGHIFLKDTDVIFITLGTSFAFRLVDQDMIVANCHKFPNDDFTRELLDQEEITNALSESINKLFSTNPNLNIVFTISPVRHIRDGLIENQRSKAQLINATHKLVADFEQVHYFPSYELIMDDLRDYRFYKRDMIHVNDVALAYVWEHCQGAFFDSETATLVKSISKIAKDCAHRPIHPNNPQHQSFLAGLIDKIKALQKEHPNLDYTTELEKIRNQLLV